MDPQILKKFHNCTIKSILTGSITDWDGNYTALNRKALQRMDVGGQSREGRQRNGTNLGLGVSRSEYTFSSFIEDTLSM